MACRNNEKGKFSAYDDWTYQRTTLTVKLGLGFELQLGVRSSQPPGSEVVVGRIASGRGREEMFLEVFKPDKLNFAVYRHPLVFLLILSVQLVRDDGPNGLHVCLLRERGRRGGLRPNVSGRLASVDSRRVRPRSERSLWGLSGGCAFNSPSSEGTAGCGGSAWRRVIRIVTRHGTE